MRLKAEEAENARLRDEVVELVRCEAASKAESVAAISDRQYLIRERVSALTDAEKARSHMLDAQSKAARLRA